MLRDQSHRMAQLGKSEAMIIVTWPSRQPKRSHDVLCQLSGDAEMLLEKLEPWAKCYSCAQCDKSANSGADCRWRIHLHSREVYPQATQPETLFKDQGLLSRLHSNDVFTRSGYDARPQSNVMAAH